MAGTRTRRHFTGNKRTFLSFDISPRTKGFKGQAAAGNSPAKVAGFLYGTWTTVVFKPVYIPAMKTWYVSIEEGVINVCCHHTPNDFRVEITIDQTTKTISFKGSWRTASPPADEMKWYSRALYMYWRWEHFGRDNKCFENYYPRLV